MGRAPTDPGRSKTQVISSEMLGVPNAGYSYLAYPCLWSCHNVHPLFVWRFLVCSSHVSCVALRIW